MIYQQPKELSMIWGDGSWDWKVWVIYDIVNDKVRKKVSDSCKDYGLYRVQKSVFLGDLNSNQRDSLALECEELVDIDTDSVYIFPMDDKCWVCKEKA